MAPKPRPAIERFMRQHVPEPNTGCWLWTSGLDKDGYAQFWVSRERGAPQTAHRFAYLHFVGPVPDGLVLDHLCRNRACVNPAHLEPVTPQENVLRGFSPLRERTQCRRGHLYDERNTYRNARGHRRCRRCHADHQRAYKRGLKLA